MQTGWEKFIYASVESSDGCVWCCELGIYYENISNDDSCVNLSL